MNSKVQAHKEICEYLNKLYEKKNHDYGDSFHQSFLEEGTAMPRIRLGDKFSRFKTLTLNGNQQVQDESIRDTLLDLANYAIMTVMEMDAVLAQHNLAKEQVAKAGRLAMCCGTIFPTEEEANHAIIQMNGIIIKSGFASIADFMELTAQPIRPDDYRYGWTKELVVSPTICRQTGGIYIPFPELERLDSESEG